MRMTWTPPPEGVAGVDVCDGRLWLCGAFVCNHGAAGLRSAPACTDQRSPGATAADNRSARTRLRRAAARLAFALNEVVILLWPVRGGLTVITA